MNKIHNEKDELGLNLFAANWISKICAILVCICIGLYISDLVALSLETKHLSPIFSLFNVTREDSIASWFSSFLILAIGGVTWVISRQSKNRAWFWISLFFVYMSVDDGIALHEKVGTTFDMISQSPNTMPWIKSVHDLNPSFSWQLLFMPFFGGMGVFLLFFLWREISQTKMRTLLVMALSSYAIAVGMDFVEGMAWTHRLLGDIIHVQPKTFAHLLRCSEEVLELLGTTFFLTLFLKHLQRIAPKIQIHLAE